jgi:hypothetical protein
MVLYRTKLSILVGIVLLNMPVQLHAAHLMAYGAAGTAFTFAAATLIYRYNRYSQTKKIWQEMLEVCKTNLDLQKILQSHPSCCSIQPHEDKLILGVGNARVGYVAYSKLAKDLGYIRFLLIVEGNRRKGFGTLLMRYAIRFLEGQGCKKIRLLATPALDKHSSLRIHVATIVSAAEKIFQMCQIDNH